MPQFGMPERFDKLKYWYIVPIITSCSMIDTNIRSVPRIHLRLLCCLSLGFLFSMQLNTKYFVTKC
jgi:hypothetical protein